MQNLLTSFGGLFLILICLAISTEAQCKKAKADDVPHGANELIIGKERVSKGIYGIVSFPGGFGEIKGESAPHIVVEIYRYSGGGDYRGIENTLRNKKRIAACLTKAGRKFSFPKLKAGRYLLRAGTQGFDGFNAFFVVITVKPSLNKRKTESLQIELSLGT